MPTSPLILQEINNRSQKRENTNYPLRHQHRWTSFRGTNLQDQLTQGSQQNFSIWFFTALSCGLWPLGKPNERNLPWHLLVCVQLWLAAFYIWKCWEEINHILILASPPYCKSILTGSSEKVLKCIVGRSRKFALLVDQTIPSLMTQHSERKKKREKKEMFDTQHWTRVETEHTLKNFLAAV